MTAASENTAPFAADAASKRLPRSASLKRRKLIRKLFQQNDPEVLTPAAGCVRILARIITVDETFRGDRIQAGFTVVRRKGAVERNRIKRLLREAYRERRHRLTELFLDGSEMLTLMIVFRGISDGTAHTIASDLEQALTRLVQEIGKGRVSGN